MVKEEQKLQLKQHTRMLKQNLIGDPYNGPYYNPPKETRKSPSPRMVAPSQA